MSSAGVIIRLTAGGLWLLVGAVLFRAGFLTQKLTAHDGNGPPAYS